MSDIGNKEIFARNLAYYIERSGKTQRDLSIAWDVPTSTINNWVMGKTYPRMGKIELMANYFGVLKSDLIEDKRKQPGITDGLTDSQIKLIEFAKTVPEDKAAMILRVMQSIVEADG